MNTDLEFPVGTDYNLRLELLGENNLAYDFLDTDSLSIQFSDIKGSKVVIDNISLYNFENPLSYVITKDFIDTFTSDPVKYKVVLSKASGDFTILTGNIYRTK